MVVMPVVVSVVRPALEIRHRARGVVVASDFVAVAAGGGDEAHFLVAEWVGWLIDGDARMWCGLGIDLFACCFW